MKNWITKERFGSVEKINLLHHALVTMNMKLGAYSGILHIELRDQSQRSSRYRIFLLHKNIPELSLGSKPDSSNWKTDKYIGSWIIGGFAINNSSNELYDVDYIECDVDILGRFIKIPRSILTILLK